MGRQIIQKTNEICEQKLGLQVISNDTDAVNMILPPYIKNQTDVNNLMKQLNQYISDEYKHVGSTGIVTDVLIVTTEEIVERIWNIAKKSYIWCQHNITANDADNKWIHSSCRD